jgi:hypothetical protein
VAFRHEPRGGNHPLGGKQSETDALRGVLLPLRITSFGARNLTGTASLRLCPIGSAVRAGISLAMGDPEEDTR